MVSKLPCGWNYERGFLRAIGCHKWVGYEPLKVSDDLIIPLSKPHFHDDTAWCDKCIKAFNIRHLGQGVCVRPKEESDDAPLPVGPRLEELYS